MITRQKIHREAVRRYNNRQINNAYSTRLQWVFSPNPNYWNSFTKSEVLAALSGETIFSSADAANKRRRSRKWAGLGSLDLAVQPGLAASIRRELGANLERWPGSERMIYMGFTRLLTCNLYVFDTLYGVGLDCLYRPTGIYPGPLMIYKGSLGYRFRRISSGSIKAGDVFASRKHTGFVDRDGVADGMFECRDSYSPMRQRFKLKAKDYRFYQVRQ